MNLQERIYSVLVVSAADNFNTALSSLLSASGYSPVVFAERVNDAKMHFAERAFDFIVVNSPLPDDPGIRFAIDACASNECAVLLLIRRDFYEEINNRVTEYGVFTLPKPTSSQTLKLALLWMASAREKLRASQEKTLSLEEKMAEIRLVNRAKWLLINALKMTESEAHKYIEKQAMNRCVTKGAVAEDIIKTYT